MDFEVKHIRKRFGGVIALKDINLKFKDSKIFGLIGANGSGKSTFARICCGIINSDDGEIIINDKNEKIESPLDASAHGIVLAHQNSSLIPDLTVWENIKLRKEKKKNIIFLDNKFDKDECKKIIEEISSDDIPLETKIEDLNPGYIQIVEIAKAISQNPKLLILDEPTAALEFLQVEKLFKKIEELKNKGVTIIFISHRFWEITRICDVVFGFKNGEFSGEVDFTKNPREEKYIIPLVINGNNENATVLKKDKEEIHNLNGIKKFRKKERKDFSNVKKFIELKNINYGTKLKSINLDVKRGEIVGIGGLNNQGQEELLMMIAGVIKCNKGTIILDSKNLKMRHTNDAIRNGIFFVPGDRIKDGLFNTHTIIQNTIIPRFTLRKEKFLISFKRFNKVLYEKIINKVQLNPPDKNMVVKNLSGGNQQKVVFGRWLQFEPKVLLLNDPAKGIDIEARKSLYELTHQIAKKGATVLLYSSSNEELIENCDRVIIMFEGKIVDEIGYENLDDDRLIKSSLRMGEISEQIT